MSLFQKMQDYIVQARAAAGTAIMITGSITIGTAVPVSIDQTSSAPTGELFVAVDSDQTSGNNNSGNFNSPASFISTRAPASVQAVGGDTQPAPSTEETTAAVAEENSDTSGGVTSAGSTGTYPGYGGYKGYDSGRSSSGRGIASSDEQNDRNGGSGGSSSSGLTSTSSSTGGGSTGFFPGFGSIAPTDQIGSGDSGGGDSGGGDSGGSGGSGGDSGGGGGGSSTPAIVAGFTVKSVGGSNGSSANFRVAGAHLGSGSKNMISSSASFTVKSMSTEFNN